MDDIIEKVKNKENALLRLQLQVSREFHATTENQLTAERDAARAELAQIKRTWPVEYEKQYDAVTQDKDAALAACEQLREALRKVVQPWNWHLTRDCRVPNCPICTAQKVLSFTPVTATAARAGLERMK